MQEFTIIHADEIGKDNYHSHDFSIGTSSPSASHDHVAEKFYMSLDKCLADIYSGDIMGTYTPLRALVPHIPREYPILQINPAKHNTNVPRVPRLVYGYRAPQVYVPPVYIPQGSKIMAPLRNEELGRWGLPGEWLFGDNPDEITSVIAVPAEPGSLSPEDIGRNPGDCCFWKRIVGRCNVAEEVALASEYSMLSGTGTAANQSRSRNLQHLPIELLWMIFSYISRDDLYSLALTTPLLCHISTPILASNFRSKLGRWVNTPLLYGATKTRLLHKLCLTDDQQGLETLGWGKKVLQRLTIIYKRVIDLEKKPFPSVGISNSVEFLWPTLRYTQRNRRRPYRVLSLPDLFPPNKEFVLRNLTDKEYVRGNLLTDTHNAGVHAKHPQWGWGFGHVIASRTGLGDDWLLHLYDDGVEKVVPNASEFLMSWAGCGFDVRMWEEVKEELMRGVSSSDGCEEGSKYQHQGGETKWKDVTEECKRFLDFLWKVNVPRKSTEVFLSTPHGILEADRPMN